MQALRVNDLQCRARKKADSSWLCSETFLKIFWSTRIKNPAVVSTNLLADREIPANSAKKTFAPEPAIEITLEPGDLPT